MKSKKVAKWAGVICLTLVGGALGYFAGKLGASTAHQLPTWMVVSLALFYIPAFFIVVALHEAGHALAGILVGFDFRMFVVGPFFLGARARAVAV